MKIRVKYYEELQPYTSGLYISFLEATHYNVEIINEGGKKYATYYL